jgi:hypothetical protein
MNERTSIFIPPATDLGVLDIQLCRHDGVPI